MWSRWISFVIGFFVVFGCVTPDDHVKTSVLRSIDPNPFLQGVNYKPCRSFLVGDRIYHHSGKIWDLDDFKVIARIPADQGEETVIYEASDGSQIYRTGDRIEISSKDVVEVLEFD